MIAPDSLVRQKEGARGEEEEEKEAMDGRKGGQISLICHYARPSHYIEKTILIGI